MPRVYSRAISQDRAIEIYEWVLEQEGEFRVRDIPNWKETAENNEARLALVRRGLIKVVNTKCPQTYKLGRVVGIERCLDIDRASDQQEAGVFRYRVAPSVAAEMGGSVDLRKYAI